jgi:mono/diheme cytochrome c family protein
MGRMHKWLIISIIGFNGYASAQTLDSGKTEFQSGCASCHGIDAKGNGPLSKELKIHPTDLTVLSKKNSGVFPLDHIYKVIDGREEIRGHGSREMPVWGYRFGPLPKLADDYIVSPSLSPELIVQSRILAVIDYLNRIQTK